MKKNFVTVAAIMVSAIFVATTIAQAADVTFSGSMKTRLEVNEQSDFNNQTNPDEFIQSRVRLNADAKINDTTSAFIQMQSVRTWGNGLTSSVSTPSGSGNSSFTANESDASVGLHQAFFTLKNFATLPVDLKMGRQEIVLDGHRLFGNTLWTIGAQTHDAIRLTHAHDNMTLTYAYIRGREDARTTGVDPNDINDTDVHVAYLNFQGILGGAFSANYTFLKDGCGPASATGTCLNYANDIHNLGFRQAGQLYGIDYRGEFNYQFGDARGTANTINNAVTGTPFTIANNIDRQAYMFGVRIGKSFKDVTLQPKLTLWYDYLSGTSEEDARNNDVKSFNTLFDTGHKFYGLMDNYLGVGAGGAANGTAGLGLQDAAIKTQISPMPGWTLKADYHWFHTAEGYAATAAGVGNNDNDLGTELDVTLVNKYNANTNISLGFSNYGTTATYKNIKGFTRGDNANWAYVMFDVNF